MRPNAELPSCLRVRSDLLPVQPAAEASCFSAGERWPDIPFGVAPHSDRPVFGAPFLLSHFEILKTGSFSTVIIAHAE
jgi:hypothetical protein